MTRNYARKHKVRAIMRARGLAYGQALQVYRASNFPAAPTLDEIIEIAVKDWAATASDNYSADSLNLDVPDGLEDAELDSCTVIPQSVVFDDQPSPEYLTLYAVEFDAEIVLRGWAKVAALPELEREHGARETDRDGSEVNVELAGRPATIRLTVRLDDGAESADPADFQSAEWAPKWGA